MTALLLLQAMTRRWYVVVVILALTGGGFLALARGGGAYSAEADVVFVPPGDQAVSTFNDQDRETLVNFVAVIQSEFHQARPVDRLAETAPLFGAGISQGYQVMLPNEGGQWEYSFPRPVLTARVVGPSPHWVSTTLDGLLERISRLAAERQQHSGISPTARIQTERAPADPVVAYVGTTRSAQVRALMALGLVGFGACAVAAVGADRIADRRRLARLLREADPASANTDQRTSRPEKEHAT
jgi:hypothetical protein